MLRASIGKTEPRHDLVEDEGDAVLERDLAESDQEAWRGRNDTLKRLQDDASDFLMMLLDDRGSSIEIVEGGYEYFALDGSRYSRRVRRRLRVIHQLGWGEAHESVLVHPMVSPLEFQYLVSSSVGSGGTHGEESGFGAAAGKAHLLSRRHGLANFLR